MFLLVACVEQVPVPDNSHKVYNSGVFSFVGPSDLIVLSLPGIDAAGGSFQGWELNVSWYFGWHAEELDGDKIEEVLIDGRLGQLTRSVLDGGRESIEVRVQRSDNQPSVLLLTIVYAGEKNRADAVRIIESLQFTSESDAEWARTENNRWQEEMNRRIPCVPSCTADVRHMCLPGTNNRTTTASGCSDCPDRQVDDADDLMKKGWVSCTE